jgi:hypothetical protein
MADEFMSYIGRCKCGEIIAATVDDPRHKKDTIREINDWLRDGLDIERVTTDYVREHFGRCKCGDNQLPLFKEGE